MRDTTVPYILVQGYTDQSTVPAPSVRHGDTGITYEHQPVYDCWQVLGFRSLGWHLAIVSRGLVVWAVPMAHRIGRSGIVEILKWASARWSDAKVLYGLVDGGEFRPMGRRNRHTFEVDTHD